MSPSKRKHIYLHIGMPKSGTTTIQHFLHLNRDELLRQGFCYPRTGGWNNGAQHNLMRESLERKIDQSLGTWKDLHIELQSTDAQKVIISSEGFANASARQITALTRQLEPYDLTVLLYLRPQWELIPSIYSQRARAGKETRGFNEFYSEILTDSDLRYTELVSKWVDGVTNLRLRVRPSQRSQLPNGNVIEDFIAGVGLSPITLGESRYQLDPDQNLRAGPRTLSVIRAVAGEAEKRGGEIIGRTLRPLLKACESEKWNEASANLISAEQVASCVASFAQDNINLAKLLSENRETFFDPPQPSTKDVDASETTREDLLATLVQLLIGIDAEFGQPSKKRGDSERSKNKKMKKREVRKSGGA